MVVETTPTPPTPQYPPETFTPEETEKLLEFRAKVSDLSLSPAWLEDANLIRWLRARDLNIKKSYEMLKASLEWRKANQMDSIKSRITLPEEFKRVMMTGAYLGDDHEGYPIFLVPSGRQDFRATVEKYGQEQFIQFQLVFFEILMDLLEDISKKQGRRVTQFVQVMDMEGYSFRQFYSKATRDTMAKMQRTFDENYPEILRYCLVINAPKAFHILYKFFKPIIPKKTLEKIEIMGQNKDLWKKKLEEKFPMELFPPYWGGTRKGSDEYCMEEDIWLTKPPSKDFFKDGFVAYPENEEETGNEELETATVFGRASFKVPVTVKVKNSEIAWRFRLDGYDIGFKIVQEVEDGEEEKEIVPYKKVQAKSKGMEEGKIKCQEGKYVVIFDNSYSYVRSKTISYSLEVIEAVEEKEKEESIGVDEEKEEKVAEIEISLEENGK